MLIVGRTINGMCVGVCSAQVLGYISELAPPTKRGRLVGAQQWAITWGIMIMFYISYGFLVHGHGDPDSPWVACEFREIKYWLEIERQSKQISYLTLFTPRYINWTHIGLFTQIWSQLTGIKVMMYYIHYVFTMAGLTGNTLLVSSSIQYVINVVMTIPALIWIDRLFANAGVLASYGVHVPSGVDGISKAQIRVTGAASKAVIACSYLFVASFAPTWGPVSWIYPPELFPNQLRGKAVAFTTSGNWAFNAWKTKNYYSTSARMEKGEELEKQLPDDRNESPVRHETIDAEKAACMGLNGLNLTTPILEQLKAYEATIKDLLTTR
ncbi:high affinity glucose transporter [Elasticomyces elasticus]|nr:high affinity glucose transporter [Elasticomyces elasticus]